jgi:tight adherence protein C
MSPNAIYFLIGIFALIALGAAIYFITQEVTQAKRLSDRMILVTTGSNDRLLANTPKPTNGSPIVFVLSNFGMFIARSGILSGKTLLEMTATLDSAGFKGERGLGIFIGTKIMAFLLVPLILYFALHNVGTSTLWVSIKIVGGAIIGLLLPETIANNIRKRHLAKVDVGVPDALDMLVICADAGLALEAGLARVASELAIMNPALSMELTQTSRELQIGSDMRKAMDSLGGRTGLDTLQRLATTLAQSLQYGTPLTAALRTLSAELRQESLVKFEERAGRLPTLMTVPMILFILPCVFLIVAGPAIINVMGTLKQMH